MPLMNSLKCQGLSGLVRMAPCRLLLHKHKEGKLNECICTIHDLRRQIGLDALKDVSLMINIKQWISVEIL
ncbi:DUF4102 domain-containing protein [Bartonella sp. OT172YNZD]|uniref:DUF4102 domain-containing protein n=1 Tax=Bartonella sp. OT172YNZD TaxID=3243572 RepID=UPI0035D1253C